MSAPGRLIRFAGLARSGNHAIINWTLKQLRRRWCFLNCVQAKTDPFESARPMDDGARHLTNMPEACTLESARRARPDHLLISFEDSFLRPCLSRQALGAPGDDQEARTGDITVVVLRDPYNLFASRRGLTGGVVQDASALRIWKQHARACLGEARGLPGNILMANFNHWTADAEYRRDLARRLGLEFTDAGRSEIIRCGGGSSFDGRAMHGRAEAMQVTRRWRRFAGDSRYRRLFDDETRRLAARLFPAENEAPDALREPAGPVIRAA